MKILHIFGRSSDLSHDKQREDDQEPQEGLSSGENTFRLARAILLNISLDEADGGQIVFI